MPATKSKSKPKQPAPAKPAKPVEPEPTPPPQVKPIAKFNDGYVSVSIWANYSEEYGTFYNTTIDRSFRRGDSYIRVQSLDRDSLLKATLLLTAAYKWIINQIALDNGNNNLPYS